MSSERFLKVRKPPTPMPPGPPPDVTKLSCWESFVFNETIVPQVGRIGPAKLRHALTLSLLMMTRIEENTSKVAALLEDPDPATVDRCRDILNDLAELATTFTGRISSMVNNEGDPSETF